MIGVRLQAPDDGYRGTKETLKTLNSTFLPWSALLGSRGSPGEQREEGGHQHLGSPQLLLVLQQLQDESDPRPRHGAPFGTRLRAPLGVPAREELSESRHLGRSSGREGEGLSPQGHPAAAALLYRHGNARLLRGGELVGHQLTVHGDLPEREDVTRPEARSPPVKSGGVCSPA